MSITFVVAGGLVSGPNGGTTAASDDTGATLDVFGIAHDNGVTGTCSDSKGNSCVGLTSMTGSSHHGRIFYAKNPVVGSGHTATLGPNNCFGCLTWGALSGLDLTAPFDVENGATSGASSVASLATGSVTPSNANSVAITLLTVEDTKPVTVPAGYTLINGQAFVPGASYGLYLAYKILTGTSAENPTWTWTGGNMRVTAEIAVFKPAAGGGGGPTINDHNYRGSNRGMGLGMGRGMSYHAHPEISLEAYRREQARKHREFMAKVRRAA